MAGWALTAACMLFCGAIGIFAQEPELEGLLPGGGPRGATTRIQIDGKNLKGARLYAGGRGIHIVSTELSPTGTTLSAQLKVDSDAPLGPHDLRLATAKGVSGGAYFWVDVLSNRVLEKAMSET